MDPYGDKSLGARNANHPPECANTFQHRSVENRSNARVNDNNDPRTFYGRDRIVGSDLATKDNDVSEHLKFLNDEQGVYTNAKFDDKEEHTICYGDDLDDNNDNDGNINDIDPEPVGNISDHRIIESSNTNWFKDTECPEWIVPLLNGDRYFDKCTEHNKDIKYFFYDILQDKHEYMCSKDVENIDESQLSTFILLQLRKCSHHISVASEQLALYFNVDGIFSFIINNMQVHYLRSPLRKTNEVRRAMNANKEARQREFAGFDDNMRPPPSLLPQMEGRQQHMDSRPNKLKQEGTSTLQYKMERKVPRSTQTTSEPMTHCITCKRTMKERKDEVVCSIECKLDAVALGIMPKHLSKITCMKHECEVIAEVLKKHNIEIKKGCILKLCLKLIGYDSSEDA